MASKKNSHANEEPVGWVTIKGVHFPKWKDGTIGWEQGQANVNDKGTMSTEELNKAEIRRDELWDKEDKHKITKAEKKELDNLQRSISEHYAAKRKYESKKVKEVSKEVKSSKNAKYDTSRAKKNKPPIEDRFSFQVAMPHPNASNDSQMKATTKLAVSQITKQFEDSGIKLSKVGAFDGSQFFIPDKGSYVVELSRTSRGDSKNQVSFNTRIWDNSTATGKNLIKRFKK